MALLIKVGNRRSTPARNPVVQLKTMALVKGIVSRIAISNAHLMICDVQERFRPLIHQMDAVINRTLLMSSGCKALDIPCIVTEHYPKIFQATVPEITLAPETKVFEKKLFSMLTPEVSTALQSTGRSHVSSWRPNDTYTRYN